MHGRRSNEERAWPRRLGIPAAAINAGRRGRVEKQRASSIEKKPEPAAFFSLQFETPSPMPLKKGEFSHHP